jgi:type IV fimbrial biogenesis protein FimT
MQMNFRCSPGFTLTELAVVLAVIAVIATFSAPSFVMWHKRDQVDARARATLFTLTLARSEAIRCGARVTLCRIDAARACLMSGKACDGGLTDWACGWALFFERDGGRVLMRMQPALAGVAVAGNGSELSFTPPSGQMIGGFRSLDFSARDGALASFGARGRRCTRIAAGGRARLTQSACGATA